MMLENRNEQRVTADLAYVKSILATPAPVSDRDYAWSFGLMKGAVQFMEAELEQLASDLVDDDAQADADMAAWEAAVDAYEPDPDDFVRMDEWENEGGALDPDDYVAMDEWLAS